MARRNQMKAMLDAIRAEDAPRVEQLIVAGLDVTLADDQGTTPLHLASQKSSVAIVQALVRAGACIERRDASGQSSLYRAAAAGHYQVVQFLSSLYTDVNHSTDFGYGTALHAAAQNANWEAARVLVASGVDPTLVNRWKQTAIDRASTCFWIPRRAHEFATRALGRDTLALFIEDGFRRRNYWTYKWHKDSWTPCSVERVVAMVLLCARRVTSRDGPDLPNLPVEMWLMILSMLRINDMMLIDCFG
eukprot:m.98668 g.98668  ORF g.98668 m.98668 type:complete len:247 (+) comp12440_c0_seq3:163-903(+)